MLHNRSHNVRLTAFSCVCAAMIFTLGISNQENEQQKVELEHEREELKVHVKGLETQISSLIDDTSILNQQLEKQTAAYNQLETDNQELKNTIKKKSKKIEQVKQQNEELKQERDRLQQKQSNLTTLSKEQPKTKTVGQKQTMNVTMYTAGYESTQKRKGEPGYGVTASGKMVQEGVTLACPSEIPFGTQITIEGFGTRTCEDRGSAITSGHLDVYTSDLDRARKFGRQDLQVTIHGK